MTAASKRRIVSLQLKPPLPSDPSVSGLHTSISADGHAAELTGNLNASNYQDGPLVLAIEAADDAGDLAHVNWPVTVNNKVPAIAASAPITDGSVISGTVRIHATAQGVGDAAIRSVSLVNSLTGLLPVTTAPNVYDADWPSDRTPDGPVILHFTATDAPTGCRPEPAGVMVARRPEFTIKVSVMIAPWPIAASSMHSLQWCLQSRRSASRAAATPDGSPARWS